MRNATMIQWLEESDWADGTLLLAMTPTQPVWAVRRDADWQGRDRAILEAVESAFDVVAFDRERQRRVWLDGGTVRQGEVTCVPVCAGRGSSGLDSRQLLWGIVGREEDGWVRLDDARIGSVWVPAPENGVHAEGRIELRQHSCLIRDEHGNSSPVNTRWTAIAKFDRGDAQ